jgi:hypothetical protein
MDACMRAWMTDGCMHARLDRWMHACAYDACMHGCMHAMPWEVDCLFPNRLSFLLQLRRFLRRLLKISSSLRTQKRHPSGQTMFVKLEICSDGVGLITFSNPPVNALAVPRKLEFTSRFPFRGFLRFSCSCPRGFSKKLKSSTSTGTSSRRGSTYSQV